MTEADRNRFGVELYKLAAALKGGQITEPLMQVFWEEFSDADVEDFVAACRKARRAFEFFPSVRELRSLLPYHPRPNPLLERLLAGFERKEPWPDRRLLGTPEFPAPQVTEAPESELDKAIKRRVRAWYAGSEQP